MAISNILSAIGNNSSVYPLLIRDCGIENPVKVVMTYNQNKKESKGIAYLAARERAFDEYATSAVWLGGIPLIGKICDYFIKKSGYNPDVNLKLFKEQKYQGVKYNIEKFKDLAPDTVKDLIKVKNNKKIYEKLTAGKFLASTSVPILFMGFILPKLVFASSAKKIEDMRKNKQKRLKQPDFRQKEKFFKQIAPSFKGNWVTKAANFSTQNKMAVTDGGYAVGRVTTARNKNESLDLSFKMAGMMLINYITPKWIEKGLNRLNGIQLDPIMLADKKFVTEARTGSLKLPQSSKPADLFAFIDDIANKDTLFIKYAKKFEKVKMLDNGIRDPRAFVDVKDLGNFRNEICQFMKKAKSLRLEEYVQFVKKAKFLKTANILTNVIFSSFLLAYVLPKAQFAFRKVVTGSDLEPGLAPAEKIIEN